MEDEEKIFRAWLYKFVKKDKILTGLAIAEKTGIKPPVITHYHSGRVVDGVRKFPSIPFKARKKILEAVGITYEEMLNTGRKELTETDTNIEKRLTNLEAKLQNKSNITSIDHPTIQQHKKLIEKFRDMKKALRMNALALKLDEIDPSAMDDLINYIEYQLNKKGYKGGWLDRASGESK